MGIQYRRTLGRGACGKGAQNEARKKEEREERRRRRRRRRIP